MRSAVQIETTAGMEKNQQPDEWQQKRSQAVKTALVLAFVAVAIFAAFVGSAIIGR